MIFEKDIKLARKNGIVKYNLDDEYNLSCDHYCGDTKDRLEVLFEKRV